MQEVFFSGWSELFRVLVVGALAYVGLVLLLRAAGKRALAKMSAYDLIVTVALGSCLATAVLSSEMKLDKAIAGFALLLALQRLAASLSVRWRWFHDLLNNEPTLLVHRGRMLHSAMRKHNITTDDIEAAIRSSGNAGVSRVGAVVIETDGTFSVIPSLEGDLPAGLTSQTAQS